MLGCGGAGAGWGEGLGGGVVGRGHLGWGVGGCGGCGGSMGRGVKARVRPGLPPLMLLTDMHTFAHRRAEAMAFERAQAFLIRRA